MASDKHLRPEIEFGYRRGLLTAAELRALDSHLSECARCRQQLAASMDVDSESAAVALHEMLTNVRQPAKSNAFRWYAAAAALVIAAGLGVWLASGRHWGHSDEIAATTQTNHALLDAEQRKVDTALRSGTVSVPEFLKDLRPKREVLMGSSSTAPMELTTPAATAVATSRPVFRWTSLGEKWKYRVRVFAPGFQLAAESPELSESTWTPDMDLPSGIDLEWQVAAVRGNERSTFPQPPAVPPRFRVLDAATISRIDQLAAQPGATNLMLAIEYAETGAVEDSRRELERSLLSNPDKAVDIRKLLDSLATQ